MPAAAKELEFGGHVLATEALVSRRLTDRISIRFGASAIVPISVTSTTVIAWGW